MLDFYNKTAKNIFNFCKKYHYRSEYKKFSDTLHSHYRQIIFSQKNIDTQKNPYPIRLEEEDILKKVLDLRYEQLKIALKMEEWSDAYRTSDNIYQLINKQKHQQSKMKQILADFYL